MDLNMINGIIRAVVPALLAFVVAKGWISEGTVADIVAAVVAVTAAIWSVFTNKPAAVVAQAAENPEVEKIVVKADSGLVSAIPSPKVVHK